MMKPGEGGNGAVRYSFSAYPNGWFRVAYSSEIAPGEVKPLAYFGAKLVLFRTDGGESKVLDAHCPHLGADLGIGGRVEGQGIRCPFHHWLWDGGGNCIDIPYAKKIPPKAKLRAWPVCEKNGVIFAYHHAEKRPPSYEVPDLPQFDSSAWRQPHVRHWKVRARWLDMNENCVDIAHFKYVHGTLTLPEAKAEIDGHVFRTDGRFTWKAPTPEGKSTGHLVSADHGPGFQTVQLTGIIDTLLMNTATPIDEEYTDVSFAYTVRTEGDPHKERLAQAVIKDLEAQFDNDLPIWENKAYFERPVLCDGDGPVGLYRKWYRQFFSL
jgi:phenylpropionate dioxygenase-like ring-hydroxylating dioxygenase large terminal subunit